MKKVSFLLLCLGVVFLSCMQADQPVMVERLLNLKCSKARPADKKISHIMLHFCSDAAVNPQNPYQIDRIVKIFEDAGVSAHFLIDRDGKIYRFVNENRIAYHAGNGKLPFEPSMAGLMNTHSIGIEMFAVGTKAEMQKLVAGLPYDKIPKEHIGFTEAQYQSLNWLISDLMRRYPDIKKDRKHIVGHDEYTPERRSDPGSLFNWKKIGL